MKKLLLPLLALPLLVAGCKKSDDNCSGSDNNCRMIGAWYEGEATFDSDPFGGFTKSTEEDETTEVSLPEEIVFYSDGTWEADSYGCCISLFNGGSGTWMLSGTTIILTGGANVDELVLVRLSTESEITVSGVYSGGFAIKSSISIPIAEDIPFTATYQFNADGPTYVGVP